VLFALAIFIIFVGTLAQVDKDMWEVIDLYFRSVIAWIDLQLFFPRTWFPKLEGKVPGTFPMPGGALIGALMAMNLLAAHLVRFKVQTKGSRLMMGLVVIAIGSLVTYLVIASGHNTSGLQGKPPFSWETLWTLVRASLILMALSSSVGLTIKNDASLLTRLVLLGTAALSGILAIAAISTMPDDSSMRILWQLIQGGLAGVILLIGCWLAFKRRAGVVLLHAGIALIMFSEFYVSQYASEGRMSIREGETINYLRDIREVELAVIDSAAGDEDNVAAIPAARIKAGQTIAHENLPFDIYIDSFLKNADLDDAKPEDTNYATAGSGKTLIARKARAATGTGGGQVDMAAAYIDVRKKGTEESLGRYLLSQLGAANDQLEAVELDGKTYNVALRFKRTYKDYQISLKDVRKDDYVGTDTPRNYSSDVRLAAGDDVVGEF